METNGPVYALNLFDIVDRSCKKAICCGYAVLDHRRRGSHRAVRDRGRPDRTHGALQLHQLPYRPAPHHHRRDGHLHAGLARDCRYGDVRSGSGQRRCSFSWQEAHVCRPANEGGVESFRGAHPSRDTQEISTMVTIRDVCTIVGFRIAPPPPPPRETIARERFPGNTGSQVKTESYPETRIFLRGLRIVTIIKIEAWNGRGR